MAHHKRKRPKNRRAGCLMCKPHKANGVRKRCNVSGALGDGLAGPWKQELKSWIKEQEGRLEWHSKDHEA